MSGLFSILNEFGSIFCEFAFEMLVQSSVLIILLYLIDVLIRKRVRAVFRYCIWMLVFVKLVLPVSLSSPISMGQIVGDRLTIDKTEIPAVVEDYKVNNTVLAEVPAYAAISKNLDAAGNKAISSEWPRSFQEVQINATKKTEAASPEPTAITWQAVVFLVWLVGLLLLSVLLFQRLLFVKSLLAQSDKANGRLDETLQQCCQQVGVSRKVELRLSKNMLSPAVCGLFKPIILIPGSLLENLSREKLRAVLIHELGHIKRGDLWVNFIQAVLQIFYFYNPLLWFANSVVRGIREKAVDEMVLTKLGDDAKIYSSTLIDIAEMAFSRPHFSLRLVGVVESKNALAGRIKHILGRPFPKSAKLGMVGLITIIIAAGILLPMAKGEYPQPEFIIKGSVTDAETGEAIAGAKVGDCERYNGGKFFAVTDSNGNYEYKTWYEEHNISAEADGYELGQKGFNTLFGLSGSEKERVIDFALEKGEDGNQIKYVEVPITKVWLSDIDGEDIEVLELASGEIIKYEKVENDHELLQKTRGDILCRYVAELEKPEITFLRGANIGELRDYRHSTLTSVPMEMPYEEEVTTAEGCKYIVRCTSCDAEKCVIEYEPINGQAKRAMALCEKNNVPEEYVGYWKGQAKIIVSWTKQKDLPIDIEIEADGSVEGKVGDAKLVNGRLIEKSWVYTKVFRHENPYRIEGDLHGRIIDSEGIQRDSVTISLRVEDGKINGGLGTSGTKTGGRETMILSAMDVSLVKVDGNVVEGIIDSEVASFKSTLANGVVVEFFGLTEYSGEDRTWWGFDGTILEQAPLEYERPNSFLPLTGNRGIDMVLKYHGAKVSDIGIKWELSKGLGDMTWLVAPELRGFSFQVEYELNSTDISFGFAAGEWKDLEEIGVNGGGTHSSELDANIYYHQVYRKNGKTYIDVSFGNSQVDMQLVAVDKTGGRHLNTDRVGGIGKNFVSYTFSFEIPEDDIELFIVQTRPFEWVTFKDVSLRAGVKSDVAIEKQGDLTEDVKKTESVENVEVVQSKVLQVEGKGAEAAIGYGGEFYVAEDYAVDLPGVGKVELVSVCQYIHDDIKEEKLCWNPDGSKPESPIYSRVSLKKTPPKFVGFVFRSTKPRLENALQNIDDLSERKLLRGKYEAFDETGRRIEGDNYFVYDGFVVDGDFVDLKLRIQPNKWSTIAEYDGKYVVGEIDERVRFIESYDSGEGAKVVFESNFDNYDSFETRVVAEYFEYNQDDKRIDRWMPAFRKPAKDATGKEVSVVVFSNLKLANIKVFRFEFRSKKYQWVEFKSVCLNPKFKSEGEGFDR